MKLRAVRIPLVDALVTFDQRPVRVVNISRTGALLHSPTRPDVGIEGHLRLTHAHTSVTIGSRVVRVDVAERVEPIEDGAWSAAITFTAPPPDEIAALLRRVVAPRRSAGEVRG